MTDDTSYLLHGICRAVGLRVISDMVLSGLLRIIVQDKTGINDAET